MKVNFVKFLPPKRQQRWYYVMCSPCIVFLRAMVWATVILQSLLGASAGLTGQTERHHLLPEALSPITSSPYFLLSV